MYGEDNWLKQRDWNGYNHAMEDLDELGSCIDCAWLWWIGGSEGRIKIR
jgi:hypothetical protein